MPVMEISVVPLGTGSPSVSSYVASCIKVLEKNRDIRYECTAMGTIIEAGELETLLQVAGQMHKSVFSRDVQRVVTTVKIDERRDRELTIQGKVNSVRNKLENPPNAG